MKLTGILHMGFVDAKPYQGIEKLMPRKECGCWIDCCCTGDCNGGCDCANRECDATPVLQDNINSNTRLLGDKAAGSVGSNAPGASPYHHSFVKKP